MQFIYIVYGILAVAAAVSWLNYRLLSRWFSFYRRRLLGFVYLVCTAGMVLIIGYSWSRRIFFSLPEYRLDLVLVYFAIAWLVGQLILLLLQPLLGIWDCLMKQKPAATNASRGVTGLTMTRREFLRNAMAAAPLATLGTGATGIYESQFDMTVQRFSLALPQLPPNLSGFKIAQISDTHLGPYFDLVRLDAAIELLAGEKPDLVVITGDFADDMNLLKPALQRFDALQASVPYGIYFCYGNHDYFRNIDLLRAELKGSRIIALENESALIVPGPQPFYLLGVAYPSVSPANGINVSDSRRQADFAQVQKAVPQDAFRVMIAHHPDSLIDGFSARLPLVLAGHTHGGQVSIGNKPLWATCTYMRGLYRQEDSYGYVSSGAGQWFPYRLGCPPEISVFTLDSVKKRPARI